MKDIPFETIDLARQLRAEGKSWDNIARATGISVDTIRYRVDDEYAEKVRRLRKGDDSGLHVSRERMSKAEIFHRLNSVPRDTRSPFAKMAGDPLPGRSALDQRNSQGSRNVHGLVDDANSRLHIEDRHSNFEAVE